MSDSLLLSVPDPADAGAMASIQLVADAAIAADGYDPFNEQARLDLAAARRTPVLATLGGAAVGTAIMTHDEFDLVVHPEHRRHGHGSTMLEWMLQEKLPADTPVDAWSHGDHPAARALAANHGFEAVRTLLQLRLAPIPESPFREPVKGTEISTFRPGVDEAEWVEHNARIFADHPEQGSITRDDLLAREAEPWFDAGDFLVLRDEEGAMIGYNWLKVDGAGGEIYVIGVDPASAGRGVGGKLMRAGLERLRTRGVTAVTLYVESDNAPAVHLYRSLGFTDHAVDVQYRRLSA